MGLFGLDYYGPMTRPKRLITLALFTALAFCGAAGAAEDDKPPVNSDMNGELFYQLLVGEISAQNGDNASAYALMLDAARKTNSPRLYERAVEIALQARSGESALLAAQSWVKAYPASIEANRYLLQILIGLNKITETLEPIKHQLAALPAKEHSQVIGMLPRYFARATEKKLAAAVVEQALVTELNNSNQGPIAWAAVGSLRYLAGDAEGALEAARHGAALNSKAEEPVLLALGLMDPQVPAAETIVRRYLDGKPLPEVRMAYTRKLLDTLRYAEAYVQMRLLTTEKPEFADGWLVRGSLELQDKKLAAAESSLKTFLKLRPPAAEGAESTSMDSSQVQAYLLLAQIAEQNQ